MALEALDLGTESRITKKYRSSGNISKIQSHRTAGKRLHHVLHEQSFSEFQRGITDLNLS